MRYLGGKTRISSHILPVLTLDFGSEFKTYVEPFVGGCGMFKHIPVFDDVNVIGLDKNPFLIALLNHAKVTVNGEHVPHYTVPAGTENLIGMTLTRNEFKYCRSVARMSAEERKALDMPDALIGYAGFIHSYRGDFFQGYNGDGSDVVSSLTTFLRTVEMIRGKSLYCQTYEELVLPEEPCIIYCDPPYKGERYVGKCFKAGWLGLMDYDAFYDKLRYWRSLGHRVILSERTAPPDFEIIWQKPVKITMAQGADNRNVRLGHYVKEDEVKYETLFALP